MKVRFLYESDSINSEELIRKLNEFSLKKGISKVKYQDAQKVKSILKEFPVGTVIFHKISYGVEKFEKVSDGNLGKWNYSFPTEAGKSGMKSEFEIAKWILASGLDSKGKFVLK